MRASIFMSSFLAASSALLFACATHTIVREEPAPDSANGASDPSTSTDGTDPSAPVADPTNPDKPASPIVANIAVSAVAVFQAVKVDVVKSGKLVAASARKAPVVAKRPGLIRVYVTPGSGWTTRDVTAEVRLVSEDGKKFPILRATKSVSVASKDEDPKTCFDLEVAADSILPGVTFQVALTADDGTGDKIKDGDESQGRFPLDGTFTSLGAELSGKLKVVIVPVKYDTDGSGRMPDVSATQVERYKKTMMQRYPTSDVEVTTHAPYPWTTTISGSGTGFSNVLRAMHQLRQRDGVAKDVYYYGLLAPTTSMSAFCPGSCVTGLSTVVDEDTAVMRASVGIGFTGQDAANTMAHEVGHAHGREHAPCGGPQGVDPAFPYPGAQIGVWGYDILGKTFIAPTKGRDMMGYCPNEWVSDYTYNALFERISAISMDKDVRTIGGGGDNGKFAIATVDGAGDLSWDPTDAGIDVNELDLHGGAVTSARFLAESGAEVVTRPARFFKFDHLPGGFILVPQVPSEGATAWKTLTIDGYKKALVRP